MVRKEATGLLLWLQLWEQESMQTKEEIQSVAMQEKVYEIVRKLATRVTRKQAIKAHKLKQVGMKASKQAIQSIAWK